MRTTKNRFEEVLFFSVLVILGLATATPCSADTIYNNLGTDNSYIINREYDTNFSFLGTTFVTTGSGALDTVLTSVFSFDSPITFGLYTNGNNAPDTLLESWSVPVPGLPGQLFTLNSVLNPVLTADTQYWFVITQTRPEQVAWYENNQGVAGGIFAGNSGSMIEFLPASPMPAIQLNSTSGGSTTTVPEPGSLPMLGFAIAGLVVAVRLRPSRVAVAV